MVLKTHPIDIAIFERLGTNWMITSDATSGTGNVINRKSREYSVKKC